MAEWDPSKFLIVVGGITVQEYAPGTFIKAEHNEDLYSLEIGADGSPCRVRNANESGTFEITLLKSSQSNAALSALAILDRSSGQGIVPVLIKDLNGTALASAQSAWIRKPAPIERGKENGDLTWVLETPKLRIFQGGIAQPGL